MKVLVTGGQGFIGNRFVNSLIASGNFTYNDIIVVDDLSNSAEITTPSYILYRIPIEPRSDQRVCKIDLLDVFKQHRPDVVFHFAAKVSVSDSSSRIVEDDYTNVCGSANVFYCSYATDVSKVVFISSGAVYGNTFILPTPETIKPEPISIYGINKYTAEQYLDVFTRTGKFDTVIFRLANVYGPRQSTELGVIKNFILKLLAKESLVIYGDGLATRDFVHVDDIVNAITISFDKMCTGTFNVGSGRGTTINELASIIKSIALEKLHTLTSVEYHDGRSCDILHSVLDSTLLSTKFSWKPKVTLYDGIVDLFEYYREHMDGQKE